MKKYFSEGLLLLVTLIWGGTFVIIKIALRDVSPLVFVSIRFSIAAIILLPFVKKAFRNANKELIKSGIILGVIFFLGFATQTIGLKYTSATKSGFITGTFILFTPVFQLLFEKKIPGKGNLLGVLFVIAGLIFLSSRGTSVLDVFSEMGENFNIGDFFTLLCAVFFAMYLVYLDIVSKKFDYMPLVFLQIFLTAVCGIVFSIILSVSGFQAAKFSINGNVIFALLYTAILATIITTILQTKYQKFVTPTKAGIIFSFEPIFAAVLAFFFIDERISSFGFIGCILIFTGLIVTELFDKIFVKNER
jgi:drug/metabolite transporter (DMT)-like permease